MSIESNVYCDPLGERLGSDLFLTELDESPEHTALDWPPPIAAPTPPPGATGTPLGLSSSPLAADVDEESDAGMLVPMRAARSRRGPLLMIGAAVTVALSGSYAGHTFGWRLPARLEFAVAPAVPLIHRQLYRRLVALVGRPGLRPREATRSEASGDVAEVSSQIADAVSPATPAPEAPGLP